MEQLKFGKRTYDPELRSRTWSLTIFNKVDSNGVEISKDIDHWWNIFTKENESMRCTWLVCQLESCPKTNRLHIQAGICYTNAKKWKTVRKIYGSHHSEPAESDAALWNYCQKVDTRKEGTLPFLLGSGPQQGKRNDLEVVANMIKEGKSVEEAAMAFPLQYIRFHKGIEKLWIMRNLKHRTTKSWNAWWSGTAGLGKTQAAVAMTSSGHEYYLKDGTQWWDGYMGEEVIIIDDFDGKWPFRNLLLLLDR